LIRRKEEEETPGVEVHIFNFRTWEAETRASRICGQPVLYREF
jgi:hypothetical protein